MPIRKVNKSQKFLKVVCSTILGIVTVGVMPSFSEIMYYPLIDVLKPNLRQPNENPEKLEYASLREKAKRLTVRVHVGKSRGSGFIISAKQVPQGSRSSQRLYVYAIATNTHVIRPDRAYKVETHDRKVYPAKLHPVVYNSRTAVNDQLDKSLFKGNDLAVLQFESSEKYPVAELAQPRPFKVGQDVYAAGFPFDVNTGSSERFEFVLGMAAFRSPQPIRGGYQLAHTSNVRNGMSGGPLLNEFGQVIAINGMRAYPLSNSVYTFPNGSKPCKSVMRLMQQSAFSIPIDRFIELSNATLGIRYTISNQYISPQIGVVLEKNVYDLRIWEERFRERKNPNVVKLRLQQRVHKAFASCNPP